MRKCRATDDFVCDRALKNDLVRNSTHPELLQEMFATADSLAFLPPRSAAREDVIKMLTALYEAAPCILWTPHHEEHSRHIVVNIYRYGPSVISISRAVWACVHVVPEQGPQLTAGEELIHSCSGVGHKSTGWNSCINPGHLVKMEANARLKLSLARKLVQKAGLQA